MGYSRGWATAGEFCRVEPRCKVAVLLDSGNWHNVFPRTGLTKPSLMMNGTIDSALSDVNAVSFQRAVSNVVWVQISNTRHPDFSGVWTLWPTVGDPVNLREIAHTICAYSLSFFNCHLKDQNDHLWEGPSTNFPRVINFKRK